VYGVSTNYQRPLEKCSVFARVSASILFTVAVERYLFPTPEKNATSNKAGRVST
jgi:hypothetical protein